MVSVLSFVLVKQAATVLKQELPEAVIVDKISSGRALAKLSKNYLRVVRIHLLITDEVHPIIEKDRLILKCRAALFLKKAGRKRILTVYTPL